MDKDTYRAFLRVLAYMVHDEARHWEEAEYPDDHIYKDVLTLQSWAIENKRRRAS